MDKDMLRQHLAQASKHVALGKRHVDAQRARVAELERHGHDAGRAKQLLAQFAQLEGLYIAVRDRLRHELADADL